MTPEDLRGALTHIHQQNWMEGVGHLFALQDSSVLHNLTLGSFFLLLHLAHLLVWLFHLVSILFCAFFHVCGLTAWAVLQTALHRHAGKWLTEVESDGQLVMDFPEMGGYHFSVASQLEAPGAELFYHHTGGHIEASKGIAQMHVPKAYHGPSHSLFIEVVIVGVVLFQQQYRGLYLDMGFGLWVSGVNLGVSGHSNAEQLVSPDLYPVHLKGVAVFNKSSILLCLNALMVMSPHGLVAVVDHFQSRGFLCWAYRKPIPSSRQFVWSLHLCLSTWCSLQRLCPYQSQPLSPFMSLNQMRPDLLYSLSFQLQYHHQDQWWPWLDWKGADRFLPLLLFKAGPSL